jgi:hypothetical protein
MIVTISVTTCAPTSIGLNQEQCSRRKILSPPGRHGPMAFLDIPGIRGVMNCVRDSPPREREKARALGKHRRRQVSSYLLWRIVPVLRFDHNGCVPLSPLEQKFSALSPSLSESAGAGLSRSSLFRPLREGRASGTFTNRIARSEDLPGVMYHRYVLRLEI